MKIALIHSYLNDRGGSQRYVIEIAKNLKLLGVEVDVFAYEYNECSPSIKRNVLFTTITIENIISLILNFAVGVSSYVISIHTYYRS